MQRLQIDCQAQDSSLSLPWSSAGAVGEARGGVPQPPSLGPATAPAGLVTKVWPHGN